MMREIDRDILKLSLPAIVSNVTVPLLGLCDTSIAGHLGNVSYLAAIAVGALIMNVITWLTGFLRMGTTGMVAQAFGRRDNKMVAGVLTIAMSIGLTFGFITIILQKGVFNLFEYIIQPESDVAIFAGDYFEICIWGMPAMLGMMVIQGWFIGRQSTVWPMVISITTNVVNIAISFIAAFLLDFGFIGIAIGTLSANWIGFIVAFLAARYSIKGNEVLIVNLSEAIKTIGIFNFFKINGNLFLRSACVMAVSTGVTALGARQGEIVLGANAVMMQFFTFFSFFMDGFAFAAEALCGRFFGESDLDKVRECVRHLMMWGFSIAFVFALAYWSGGMAVVRILTDVDSVINMVEDYKIFLILIPIVSVTAFICDGIYIGFTMTGRMLFVTLISSALFFMISLSGVVTKNINFGLGENVWLWIAFLSYLLLRGVGLEIMLPGVIKSQRHRGH